MLHTQDGYVQSRDGVNSIRYPCYVQPGGDEEVTLLDVNLATIGRYTPYLTESPYLFQEDQRCPLQKFKTLDRLRDFAANDTKAYDIRL